jgi:DNA-binding transcriptional MerR regulator
MEEKLSVRIGDLATSLGVERSVIRFWEREFGIKTKRSDGGQRYYEQKDVSKFHAIKELLYQHGYTIAGAKQHLKQTRSSKAIATPATPELITTAHEAEMETTETMRLEPAHQAEMVEHELHLPQPQPTSILPSETIEQLLAMQRKLMRLKTLLRP